MAEHERHIEIFGIGVGSFRTAYIRRRNNHILQLEALDIGDEYRGCVKMIDRDIEETLDLIRVKIHGDQAGNAGRSQHVGHEFGSDRHAGFVLAVLTRPSEIRNNRYYRACRSTLGRIDHKKKFHQIV